MAFKSRHVWIGQQIYYSVFHIFSVLSISFRPVMRLA